MPWDAQIVEDCPERVSAKFWVRAVRTPFYVEKTVTLESGSPILTVTDTLTNEAEEPAPAQWGQHVALGEPFLTPNCILDIPAADFFVPDSGDDLPAGSRLRPGRRGTWPNAEGADGRDVDLRRFPAKEDRLVDYLSFCELSAGWYAVTNPDRGVGFGLSWDASVFRYLWYWQVFGGHSGYPWYKRTYNVGLEPFTSLPGGMEEPGSDASTSIMFEPGETRTSTVRAVVYESVAGVDSITDTAVVSTRD